jgi:glutaconate CoA-transferase subunit B
VTIEQAREATGWTLRVAEQVEQGMAPTAAELRALRGLRVAGEETTREETPRVDPGPREGG